MDSALVLRLARCVWLLRRCGASVWFLCVRWSSVLLARVRTRAASRCCARAARVASPHSLLPRRVATAEPSSLVDGWALTLCLCSYDARFSGDPQVVARLGVLRFGHRVWAVCCGVPLLSIPPPPVLISPPPCLMGVPLFCVGVGCLLQPPSLLWPTPLFVRTPWACFHCVWRHTLKPSGTNPIHQLHREEEP